MLKTLLLLVSVFILSLTAQATEDDLSFKQLLQLNQEKNTLVIDRTYTKTNVKYPKLCELKQYQKSCNSFIIYFVSKFEHTYISYITENRDFDDIDFDDVKREVALQEVDIDYRVVSDYNFATIIANVEQRFNQQNISFTEIFNYNITTSKIIHFNDLFADPSLAALICKNIISDAYAKVNSDKLPLLLAQIEVSPKNFLLLPDGVEFVFSKSIFNDNKISPKVVIKLDRLMEAKPKLGWFPVLQKQN